MITSLSLYFSYKASRSLYCGVLPHIEAVFTIMIFLTLKSAKLIVPPVRPGALKSYMDDAVRVAESITASIKVFISKFFRTIQLRLFALKTVIVLLHLPIVSHNTPNREVPRGVA